MPDIHSFSTLSAEFPALAAELLDSNSVSLDTKVSQEKLTALPSGLGAPGKELFAMADIQAGESGARVVETHNLRLEWSTRNELGNDASCDIVVYSREAADAAALLVESTNDEFDVAFTVFVA